MTAVTSNEYLLGDGPSLSRLPAPAGTKRKAPAAADGARSGHVLIVDDEPAIVEVLREVLSDEGYQVTSHTAPPTPDEIGRLAPDVVVLDLVFGGRNVGLGLLNALRGHPPTAVIPIVVCTALIDPSVASALADLRPAVHLLRKPFDLDAVVTAVRGVSNSTLTNLPA